MNRPTLLIAAVAASLCASTGIAKLPPPSDEAKAKAAEAAAKAAHADKVAAYQLCKSMDKAAAVYFADAKKTGKQTKAPVPTPPCTDPGPFAQTQPQGKQAAATPPSTKK
jgi:hypothetical protein